MTTVDAFLNKMYRSNGDFVFTVRRDFVRACTTPILVLPDDIPAQPFAVAMQSALLAPNAEVNLYPWKEPKHRIRLAVRHVRAGTSPSSLSLSNARWRWPMPGAGPALHFALGTVTAHRSCSLAR